VAKASTRVGKSTERRETLRLTHKTVFPIEEKRRKETKIGQKEV